MLLLAYLRIIQSGKHGWFLIIKAFSVYCLFLLLSWDGREESS